MQIFCDPDMMQDLAPTLREIARDMPVIVDHCMMMPATRGVNDPNFQALLKLVAEGHAHVKVSAPYRVSMQYPDYPDVRALHEALVRTNPERLMWGTDWPHPQIDAAVMPDDGHLLDLFCEWTPDEGVRRKFWWRRRRDCFGRSVESAARHPISVHSRASGESRAAIETGVLAPGFPLTRGRTD